MEEKSYTVFGLLRRLRIIPNGSQRERHLGSLGPRPRGLETLDRGFRDGNISLSLKDPAGADIVLINSGIFMDVVARCLRWASLRSR